jgi:serine dehydrogenase proteinase
VDISKRSDRDKAQWFPSSMALTEDGEDSEFTVTVSPAPAALSVRSMAAIRRLERHFDREIFFLIMRENSLKDVTGFSHFMVEAIRNHRADLPQRALVVLDTIGGNPLGAFKLGRLFQQTCESHVVVIPKRAMSAGTLFALSSNQIFLSPEAELGPCDIQMDGRSSLVIHRSKDYVQGVFASIAKAITSDGSDKKRPYAETTDLLSHIQAAANVPQLALQWGEAMEGLHSVKDYLIKLLTAQDYTLEQAEDIAWNLVLGYHDHGFPIDCDELQGMGVKNVHTLNFESQKLVDDLMTTLPSYPIVGTVKPINCNRPGNPRPPRTDGLSPSEDVVDPAPLHETTEAPPCPSKP